LLGIDTAARLTWSRRP